jgi:two-component system sensor histidine kinase HydH
MTAPTEIEREDAGSARRRLLSKSALIAAAALGPLLIGSVIYGHRAVSGASQAVLRGEAEAWTRQIGSRLREVPGPPKPAMLSALLEEAHPDGLRYVGYLSGDRRIEAGTPTEAINPSELRPGQVVWRGRLVRFAMPMRGRGPRPGGPPRDGRREGEPPRPEGADRPPEPPSPGAGPGPSELRPPPPGEPRLGGEPPRPPRLTWLVVEFEPRTWDELTRTSRTTVALGSVTAMAVCLLAFLVWRSTRRLLVIEREAARARHLAALGEMSAVLAHEIRNPLTSLKGHSQLLTETLAALGLEKPRSKAERVVSEALRLERITNDLLDFVRQGELERTPADLAALVRQAAEAAVPAERLVLSVPDEGVVLPVDAGKLGQLIDNLVQNAVQAGDGPVEVTVALEAREVVISVRDHGPGIPVGQEERIFEPFVTTRVRGTGLGLAIARRIADRHGGSLVAANHPEGGALFRLGLPREARKD